MKNLEGFVYFEGMYIPVEDYEEWYENQWFYADLEGGEDECSR